VALRLSIISAVKKLLIIAGWALGLGFLGIAEADTLFTTPVLYVTPTALDFGAVADKATATNTFLVENMGKGTLVGTATVAAPFKILSGGNYSLRENETQIVTVIYTPSGAASDTQTVKFTGSAGAKVIVTGKLAAPAAKEPGQK
jgi:hypothetical protein